MISKDRLVEIEADLREAWTCSGSTPFIAEIQLSRTCLEDAVQAARQIPLMTAFHRYPTLAVWSVLYPLAKNYGAGTKDVYLHISQFVGEDLSELATRDTLKSRFRTAARALGLPVQGNDPTPLFFVPLGPARAQHVDLAKAFVGAALQLGPPAIEDTSSARSWQRRVVTERCPGLSRLRETIHFDSSAHCARRFEAWRQGEASKGEAETALFAAYEQAARSFGRSRADLVGPPRLIWHGERLALEAERSRQPQSVRLSAFPTPLTGGRVLPVAAPWRDQIAWSAGTVQQNVPFAPAPGEVLIFDADSGACLGRVSPDETSLEVAAERLVVLSRSEFSTPSFGDAVPSHDAMIMVAWITSGEVLTFADRPDLSLPTPRENAIWIDGAVLGRDGTRALYACHGALRLRINPDIGGAARIVRARLGDTVRFVGLEVAADGTAQLDFCRLGFVQPDTPGEVIFDVLAPGAAGDLEARAELSTRAWIWPGVAAPAADLAGVLVPENYNAARSAGLKVEDGRISVDHRAEEETPILGLQGKERVHEFRLTARSEKLWHCRILQGDRVFVPRGATLALGHDNRHDTLRLRSPDRDATLIILGREKRRPFIQRNILEIGASELECPGTDDRIALRRADGRVDLLVRLRRIDDPTEISLEETGDTILLTLVPQREFDGVRIRIEAAIGHHIQGDYRFGHNPAELPPLPCAEATCAPGTRQLKIRLDRAHLQAPARVVIQLRDPRGDFSPLVDASGAPIALGIGGSLVKPDLSALTQLASFLAEPEPEALSGQLSRALMPTYGAAIAAVGASRMASSIRPVLNITCSGGGTPRHDLVGVAPWIFEAPASAFSGLTEASGLAALTGMQSMPAPDAPPSVASDTPLSDWLSRIGSDSSAASAFSVDALQHAFRALRHRLRDSDLHALVGEGSLGSTSRLICATHMDGLDQIRSFDTNGGGDPMPARVAVQIERYARACAARTADHFVADIVFRTGLPRADVGRTLTMMMRAGIEFFVYFRALWAHGFQVQVSNI